MRRELRSTARRGSAYVQWSNQRSRRRAAAVVSAVLAAGMLAACGSGDPEADPLSGVEFTGDPIIITTQAGVDTPLGSFPEIFSGANAAALAINKNGGISGHELIVKTCNTKLDPNGEVSCARQADTDGAVAAVGDFTAVNADAHAEALNNAGIPEIAGFAVSTKQRTLPNMFPITNLFANKAACLDPAFTDLTGADAAVGVVLGITASQSLDDLNRTMASGLDNPLPIEDTVGFDATTTDYTPVVQRIDDSEADLLILNTSNPTSASLLTTAQQLGKDWSYCADFGALNGELMKGLGAEADGGYLLDYFPPPTAAEDNEMVAQFAEEMKAQEDTGDEFASLDPDVYSGGAMNAWLGVQIFKQAAETIDGDVTKESVMEAMQTLKPDLGGLADIDFSKPLGTGDFARIFNPYIVLWHWDPDKQDWYLVDGVHTDSLQAVGARAGS